MLRILHITDLHLRKNLPGSSPIQRRHCRLMPHLLTDVIESVKVESIDVIIITGDIIDTPYPLLESNFSAAKEDYRLIKKILAQSKIPYLCVYGNHDDPNAYLEVFPKEDVINIKGYEFIPFYDHQLGNENVAREGGEFEKLKNVCSKKGQKNQIHIQHYLIHPKDNLAFPHTYSNAEEIKTTMTTEHRVLLCLSGHQHRGHELEKVNETYFYTGQSLCEPHLPYSIIEINGESISVNKKSALDLFTDTRFHNPYPKTGKWLRGNLHTHCEESSRCSTIPLEKTAKYYSKKKHHFLAITDHDKITNLNTIKERYPDMVFFEGFEHSVSNHMLFVHEKTEPFFEEEDKRLCLTKDKKHLTVVCHPQGPRENYWTVDELKNYPALPHGVEVFNGHYGVSNWRIKGSGWDYSDFWQSCLDEGLKLWAYANDDYHDGLIDLKNGWNLVLTKEKTHSSILESLKHGASVATTGLSPHTIQSYRNNISISFSYKVHGKFITNNHEVLHQAHSTHFDIPFENQEFIRFEAEKNGRKCWIQPFFNLNFSK